MVSTNGFDYNAVYDALKNRVLWRSQGGTSDSLRYFEDFHPLNDTNILDEMRPSDGTTLTAYLNGLSSAVIMECLNAVYNRPQVIDQTKLCFYRLDNTVLVQQPAQNEGQFVGLKVILGKKDKAIRFSSLELFFTETVTFNMYLYNDMTLPPVYTKSVTAQAGEQTIIDLSTDVILNYLTPTINKGGIWYFGYYQNDLGSSQAVYYPIVNSQFYAAAIWSYSAPTEIDIQGNRNFQRNVIGSNNLTYGLNLEVSTYVDATNTIVQAAGSGLFDELIGQVMAVRSVTNQIFSYRTNATQRNIADSRIQQLYGELNGYKADSESPYVMGLKDIVNRTIKTVKGSFQKEKINTVGIS